MSEAMTKKSAHTAETPGAEGYYHEEAVTASQRMRFELAASRLINESKGKAQKAAGADEGATFGGIGTYGEKRLHAVLKDFICEEKDRQEIKIGGRGRGMYVADILTDGNIYEIQTGGFYPLQKKIEYYLENTDYKITIVHPVIEKKHLVWIDPADGSVSKRNASPKKGSPGDLLSELIYLLPFIPNERLYFRILVINADEYRLKNGYGKGGKRGSERFELIPIALVRDITLQGKKGVIALLPDGLSESVYTAEQFRKKAKIKSPRSAYYANKVLLELNISELYGKDGRKFLYRIRTDGENG